MAIWRNSGRSSGITDTSHRAGGRDRVTAQVSR